MFFVCQIRLLKVILHQTDIHIGGKGRIWHNLNTTVVFRNDLSGKSFSERTYLANFF